MGTNIRDIVKGKEIVLEELAGRKVALDAFNALYQFLAAIRQPDGTPLIDSQGRITSHLSGLFYRTINLLEKGIKVVYVFDGEPPEFKKKEIERRRAMKEEAEKELQKAIAEGRREEIRKLAQRVLYLTEDMIEDSKRLLTAMGIPWVQAPSEGEAQAAYMSAKGDVYAAASQDYDSLLFGAKRLVRNLTITGKRKLPGKDVYIEIKPEVIELDQVLKELGITREQLVIIGILVGTDYNEGIEGIGPKRALELVRKYRSWENIKKVVRFKEDYIDEVYKWFLNPKVTDDYKLEWKEPDEDKVIEILVEEHDFSEERVRNALERLERVHRSGVQTSLSKWFG